LDWVGEFGDLDVLQEKLNRFGYLIGEIQFSEKNFKATLDSYKNSLAGCENWIFFIFNN